MSLRGQISCPCQNSNPASSSLDPSHYTDNAIIVTKHKPLYSLLIFPQLRQAHFLNQSVKPFIAVKPIFKSNATSSAFCVKAVSRIAMFKAHFWHKHPTSMSSTSTPFDVPDFFLPGWAITLRHSSFDLLPVTLLRVKGACQVAFTLFVVGLQLRLLSHILVPW